MAVPGWCVSKLARGTVTLLVVSKSMPFAVLTTVPVGTGTSKTVFLLLKRTAPVAAVVDTLTPVAGKVPLD
jgi:hypothetical protein